MRQRSTHREQEDEETTFGANEDAYKINFIARSPTRAAVNKLHWLG